MIKLNRRLFLGAIASSSAALVAPRAFAAAKSRDEMRFLPQALAALEKHSRLIPNRDLIGIVDFSSHSREPRFHLVDVAGGGVSKSFLVSHGRGSDPANSGWLQKFSNQPGSNASSQGSYITERTYYGKHGQSRRLKGLDPENNNAYPRAIVIHGATYVSRDMARNQGRVGRSQGCFAVCRTDINEVLERLGPGRLLYAAR